MRNFILSKLLKIVPTEFSVSFCNLPSTEHKDGKFRLRRYSVIDCHGKLLDTTEFIQSSEYNKYQGDIARAFQPIEKHVHNHNVFMKMIDRFRFLANLHHDHIDVHQMRIITNGDEPAEISPEGPHQDGYDVVGVVGIHRHNITGGNLLLYKEKGGVNILSHILKNGEAVIIDDRILWHNGTSIKAINPDEPGFMDVFILLANRAESPKP